MLVRDDVAQRVDLDPRAAPATYFMKFADGVFLEYDLLYVGSRNPTESEQLMLASAFLNQDIGFFNFWDFEMLAPPSPEDQFVQYGERWIVRKVTRKLFHNTRYRVLCLKAVGN